MLNAWLLMVFGARIPAVQAEKRGLTGDMVYTTIVNDDVEALLGYDMIEAYLHNSRKSMWALQRLELFGI